MATRQIHRLTGVEETVGAVTSVLASLTIPDAAASGFQFTAVGRDTTTGDTVTISKAGGSKRVGGTLSVVGALAGLLAVNDASLATASATVAVNGSALELQVTGVALTTVEWFGELTVWIN